MAPARSGRQQPAAGPDVDRPAWRWFRWAWRWFRWAWRWFRRAVRGRGWPSHPLAKAGPGGPLIAEFVRAWGINREHYGICDVFINECRRN
jgi:hypothetical protein